ncbi:type II/IV secretion system ATPase subunit [Candidatus Woesearchaeota archaeon]|nr:type II/IV secretion system ATPase subunit [Candidatus Woesearchaeota archaeon]
MEVKRESGILDTYQFVANQLTITVTIQRVPDSYVPVYHLNTRSISPTTELVIERIRQDLISTVELGPVDIAEQKDPNALQKRFDDTVQKLVRKYFPDTDDKTISFLHALVMQRSFGLGELDSLMYDSQLEEVAVNNAEEPVWVYHRKWGWLRTNIKLKNEEQAKHYASSIGRKVGRQLNILEPLMDANLSTGDRVNATLMPISAQGNTITMRKFASKPWTITDMISTGTITPGAAAFIWEAMQYELSVLISGGTATGKTSFLNSLCAFFPPNQRIISIEDTRELQLPKFLQWIPMVTRLPNQEGKGAVDMLALLVNSLRMRPDRILVGEIRRKREAEVLFEAIHTGHSVYATVHANNAEETITRLTNPPIEVPKSMLPALSMIVVQTRNRRTGIRRTFQVAEITKESEPRVLMQYDLRKDKMQNIAHSKSIMDTLHLYTGISGSELRSHLNEKEKILKWLVKKNLNTVDSVGDVMAQYYTGGKLSKLLS